MKNLELKPRFLVGDEVWVAGTYPGRTRIECPDCNGSRSWTLVSPAGDKIDIDCPRCSGNLGRELFESVPSLEITEWQPTVHRLLVGSIRTLVFGDEIEVKYFEESSGEGRAIDGRDVCATRDEAFATAREMANKLNEIERRRYREGWTQAEIRKIGNLPLKAAAGDAVRRAIFNGWLAFHGLCVELRYAMRHQLCDKCGGIVTGLIDAEKKYGSPGKLDRLLEAIEDEDATIENIREVARNMVPEGVDK